MKIAAGICLAIMVTNSLVAMALSNYPVFFLIDALLLSIGFWQLKELK